MLDIDAFYQHELLEHLNVLMQTKEKLPAHFAGATTLCLHALKQQKKLLFFGNGGSAADAQHLATELAVRYKENRPALPAIALTTDSSILTAIGNDLGFDQLFARQIEALGNTGDVAIGISTSGNSPNIIKAFETAKRLGLRTLAFTGMSGGQLRDNPNVEIALYVPSLVTARIQEMHIMLGQMLCHALEISLGLVSYDK